MPFRTLAGHRRIRALLGRAVAQDTVPPSLILAGPRGVGKRRAAQALAEVLNCAAPVTDEAGVDACGTCAQCRRIGRGTHPDVIVIEPGDTGAIKIEQVRDVIDRAAYRPFEGRRRVVIIDDADAMASSPQSALLKTLEEPPSASVFLLISSTPDALLATVRSRCPRLRFGPLSASEVAGVLVRDHGYAEAEARAVAAGADGSVGQALTASSVDVVGARNAAEQLLVRITKLSDPGSRLALVKDLAGGKGAPAADRTALAACLTALLSLLRDVSVLASRADRRVLAHADLEADLARLTAGWGSSRILRAFAAVDRALYALDRNAGAKVVADWLVLRL
jgi:DNA polymerase-3 subunit delta'